MTDTKELGKIHSDSQQKFAYYITGLSIAGIAYITSKTAGKPFEWSQIPIGISLLFFGWSTYSGLKYVLNFLDYLETTDAMIDLERTLKDPRYSEHIAMNLENKEVLQKKISKIQGRGVDLWGNLILGFITGLLFYIIWHLVEMYIKTI